MSRSIHLLVAEVIRIDAVVISVPSPVDDVVPWTRSAWNGHSDSIEISWAMINMLVLIPIRNDTKNRINIAFSHTVRSKQATEN
jgi:hypothetical protein